MGDDRPRSPTFPPPDHKYRVMSEQLRLDADRFSNEAELQILSLRGTVDRTATARADRMHIVESGGDNLERLRDVTEEIDALDAENKERFDRLVDMIQKHRAFMLAIADALVVSPQ